MLVHKPFKYRDFSKMKVGMRIRVFHYAGAWTTGVIKNITEKDGVKTLHYSSESYNAGGYGGYKETPAGANAGGTVSEYYERPVTWEADKFIKKIEGAFTKEPAWIVYDGDVYMWMIQNRDQKYYGGESDTPEQAEKDFQRRDELIDAGDTVMI